MDSITATSQRRRHMIMIAAMPVFVTGCASVNLGLQVTPPNGWSFESRKLIVSNSIPGASVNFVVTKLSPNDRSRQTVEDGFEEFILAIFRKNDPQTKLLSSSSITLAGRTGKQAYLELHSLEIIMRQLLFFSGRRLVVITCTAKAKDFDRVDREGFDPILSSLVWE